MLFPELSTSILPKDSWLHRILWSFLGLGILLVVAQYVYNRNLWIDEAGLALSIIRRSFDQLTQPLDYDHVAPVGFLMATRLSVAFFGKGEMALRLFPLLCYLTAIPSFFFLLNRFKLNKTLVLVTVATFCLSLSLIRYATEMKQYSSDVLVGILIVYATLRLALQRAKNLVLYALIGTVAIWFSNISIIMLAVCGLYVAFKQGYLLKQWQVAIPFIAWLFSFCIYYFYFIHGHPAKKLMLDYWEDAFMPTNPFSMKFWGFVLTSLKGIYSWMLGFGPFWFFPFLLSCAGTWFLLRSKHYLLLYFIFAPIVCHLSLSALKLYPFSERLILYLAPSFILLYCIGAWFLTEILMARFNAMPKVMLLTPVLLCFIPLAKRYPIQREEIKECLQFMQENSQKKETIYVYYSANMAYLYYTETTFFNFDNGIVFGKMYRENPALYIKEISSIKGKIWLLFSHVYPFDTKENEEKYILTHLPNTKTLKKHTSRGSSVYLVERY